MSGSSTNITRHLLFLERWGEVVKKEKKIEIECSF